MDFLKRSLAPITDAAWEALGREAKRSLATDLSARRVVDVAGPKGLDFTAVGLGRLDVPDGQDRTLCYGIHRTLPLVEVRAAFEMNIWELDNIERGAKDIDYLPLLAAAERMASFEERAVYKGFKPAGIVGLEESAPEKPIALGFNAVNYPDAVSQALLMLQNREIDGPYALLLGPGAYEILGGSLGAYPPRKQIEEIVGGRIILSPFIEGGFLVSTRGGDLELTIGQDFAIGYETHDTKKVRLFLTESFTFRVLEPEAVVSFQMEVSGNGARRPAETRETAKT